MKATTFLGVATCALMLAGRQYSLRVVLKLFALGAAGVALIVLNAAISTTYVGIVLDSAYLAVCVIAATRVRPPEAVVAGLVPPESASE